VNLNEYDYELPPSLIAQKPAVERGLSRLMVLGSNGSLNHRTFVNLPEYFKKGDILIVNDTRVFPARLYGIKEKTCGEVEIFLLHTNGDGTWEALCRPSRRLREGMVVIFGDGLLRGVVLGKGETGHIRIRLESEMDIDAAVDKLGKTPLPHYIRHEPSDEDRERYQTVYALNRGAVAAPTAGLHFTEAILDDLRTKGVIIASVTLHVGIGTFRPLTEELAASGHLHSEFCKVPPSTVEAVTAARKEGGRICAVGTTSARALESASASGVLREFEGWTDIFIKPPFRFRMVDMLITNFHLPKSSLLLLVSAFAGRERILESYDIAIREKYRFYSYGDAMLIF
jgi:S-adenosylmethionine:tRNA ribosyltransferase-isomerase